MLHSFNGSDGAYPAAGLIFDAAGNLYGTTYSGGQLLCGGSGCGVVFKLAPNQDGSWTESVLHSFNGSDGCATLAGLIFDAAGNLSARPMGRRDIPVIPLSFPHSLASSIIASSNPSTKLSLQHFRPIKIPIRWASKTFCTFVRA